MSRHPGLVVAAVVVAGLTGATAAYQAVAPPGAASSAGDTHGNRAPTAAAPTPTPSVRTRIRFHPCPPQTRLEHRACVRHLTRVVVEPAAASPTP